MRITALSVLIASLTACAKPAVVPLAPDSSAAAIARVTTRLRPAIIVKGGSVTTFALADRMAHYRVTGVSIAVVNDGEIVWSQGYGVKEARTTGAVSPTTLFQAASISKPVAATAMLRLVEQNRLALDTPVNQYLRSWKVPDNLSQPPKKSRCAVWFHTPPESVYTDFPDTHAARLCQLFRKVLTERDPPILLPCVSSQSPAAHSATPAGASPSSNSP